MKIHAENRGKDLYITLYGELDEHSAAKTRRETDALIENALSSERAIFDLSEVSFMDSTAIGFLIGRYKTCRRYGVNAYLINPTQSADKILLMSGVYSLMPKI